MENKEFRECTECRSFVWCESPKQYFHKSTGIPCEEFEEAPAFKEQREKIAALIGDACERAAELELPAEELNSFVAAWLLREGMLLPPVKIGQTVYAAQPYAGDNDEDIIEPWQVAGYEYFDGKWYCCDRRGGEFFEVGSMYCKLTREEAEEVVKGWERDGSR
jgi:hypothetical protein